MKRKTKVKRTPCGKKWEGRVSSTKTIPGFKGRMYASFRDKEVAQRWLDEAWAAIDRDEAPPAPVDIMENEDGAAVQVRSRAGKSGVTLASMVDKTNDAHWKHGRNHTARSNAEHILELLGPDLPIAAVTTERIERVKAALLETKIAKSTVNRKLAALSKMMTHALDLGYIAGKPRIKKMREPQGRVVWLDQKEEAEVLGWCDDNGEADFRDLIILLIDSGVRIGEAMALTWDDIDLDGGRIHVRAGKSARARRSIPMTSRLKDMMEKRKDGYSGYQTGPFASWLDKSRSSFNKLWNRMKDDLGKSDRDEFVPHALRHTFCSRLAMRGVDSRIIKELAGHSTIAVTDRYMHLNDASLQVAIEKLEGAA